MMTGVHRSHDDVIWKAKRTSGKTDYVFMPAMIPIFPSH